MSIQLLIRSSLEDTGTLPRTGDVTDSPDVIPFQKPLTDPVKYLTDHYDENLQQQLQAQTDNYVYVRALNLSDLEEEGDVYAYYAADADLDTPSKWTKNSLQNADGNGFTTIAAGKQELAVTELAFVWNPASAAIGKKYSLISIVVPKGTKPDFSKVSDFEEYVRENNNIGWTKVVIVKPTPPPTPVRRWKTTFTFAAGSTARPITFAMECQNIPVGGYISFSAEKDGPTPPIALNQTRITDSNGSYAVESQVAADYTSKISFEYLANGDVPKDSTITFVAYYIDGGNSGPQKKVILASVKTTN